MLGVWQNPQFWMPHCCHDNQFYVILAAVKHFKFVTLSLYKRKKNPFSHIALPCHESLLIYCDSSTLLLMFLTTHSFRYIVLTITPCLPSIRRCARIFPKSRTECVWHERKPCEISETVGMFRDLRYRIPLSSWQNKTSSCLRGDYF